MRSRLSVLIWFQNKMFKDDNRTERRKDDDSVTTAAKTLVPIKNEQAITQASKRGTLSETCTETMLYKIVTISLSLLVCVSVWMRARILLFIALYSLLHFYRFVESICKKYFDFVEWCVIFIYKEKIDEPTKPEQIGQDEDAKRKCRKRRTSERKAKHIHSGTGDGQSEDVVAITYKPNADTLSFPPFNIEKILYGSLLSIRINQSIKNAQSTYEPTRTHSRL